MCVRVSHEDDIEIYPKKIESIQKVQPPQSKNDIQKFLGKFCGGLFPTCQRRLMHLLRYSI
jgi:hypothetical protein